MKAKWCIVEMPDDASSDGVAVEFICDGNHANAEQATFIAHSRNTSSTAC